MKTTYAVILCVLLLLVSACAQKVNDPADVQAIKNLDATFDKSYNAGKAEALVADIYSNDAVRFIPNAPSAVGKDAIRASFQKQFDQFSYEGRVITEDVRISGDLAVSKGTYEDKSSLKAGGHSAQDKGKWVTVFQRQTDGSWKALWDIANSDLPVADTLPPGQEELALLQLERDWAAASIKKDMATLDRILATEFQANYVGLVGNKQQFLSILKSGTSKTESAVNSDMKAIVFGDRAIVNGLSTEKSSLAGKDTSGQYRWTDVFVKRDGRWQCVTGYAAKVQ
jgi:uncharacterized protein (TIGR02246 family)